MTTNDEVLTAKLGDEYDLIKKCWSPYAIVYNPLKIGSIDGTDTIPHDRAISRALYAHYKPNRKVVGNPECTLFVSRLSESTTESTLRKVFSEYGVIKRCRLVEDVVTGRSKCYGFIEYDNEASTARAYRRSSLLVIDDKQVIVDYECERILPGWIPRRLGGGFCGKKESGQLRFGCRYKPFKKPINLLTDRDKEAIESKLRDRLGRDSPCRSETRLSTSEQGDRRSDRGERRLDQGKSRSDRKESRLGRGESRLDRGESRSDRGESRFNRGESRSDRGESRLDQGKHKTDRESRLGRGESRLEQGKRRLDRGESRSERGESKSQRHESRSERGVGKSHVVESRSDVKERDSDRGIGRSEKRGRHSD